MARAVALEPFGASDCWDRLLAMASPDADLKLARQALERFGINGHLRKVATGLDTTYRANTDAGDLALRIGGAMDIRRPEAVVMEAAWLDALQRDGAGVTVPAVRRTLQGDRVAILDDEEGRRRGCLALEWLPGIKMRWRFTPAHAFVLARTAALLHDHAATFVPPEDGWAKTWSPDTLCGLRSVDRISAIAGAGAVDAIHTVHDRMTQAYADLGATDWVLINADLGPHNTLFRNREPALFDFNDLGFGYAGHDFARYLHSLRWRPRGEELVAAAIAGYESVAPLPASFQRYGELFETAAGLFLAGYLAPKVAERGPETAATIARLVDDARRWSLNSGTPLHQEAGFAGEVDDG